MSVKSRDNRSISEKLIYIKKRKFLYILLIPVLVYFIIFYYLPIWGIAMAFQDYNPIKGLFGSSWVGLKHFEDIFHGRDIWRLLRNTVLINTYSLVFAFPMPIIFALMLNEVRNMRFKKLVQTVTYMPHFLSTVVVVGMVFAVLSPSTGFVNNVIAKLGGDPIYFVTKPEYFRTIFIASGIWQRTGWESIIYLAAITSIDPALYEAAEIDGARKMQQIFHVTLPSIASTIVFMFIMAIGKLLNIEFEKIYLMATAPVKDVAYVISVYVYEKGIIGGSYGLSTAIGLFNSIISMILVITANKLSHKFINMGLW
ncbi:MAG: ABC transporter permease subunit [Clostridiaceae bacterium]